MRNILFIIILAATIISCEKTVELDLNQTPSKIVIEGQVTDHEGYQYVKVGRTSGFYTTGQTPRISTATVAVSDNDGNNFSFVHNPTNHVDSVGYYLPTIPFVGQIGKTYTLTVVVDGQTYEAKDQLYRVSPIDKLEIDIDEEEQEDPEEPGQFFEIKVYIKEPQDTKDYYLFKSYRNDLLEYDTETDVYYADDELVGESIDGISAPLYYAVNDKARVEVYSLSRDGFIFYRDLSMLLNNDGGMFGTPPADPRSNISNGALGFFQVSAVTMAEILIAE